MRVVRLSDRERSADFDEQRNRASPQRDLINALRARFPLVDRIFGEFGESTPEETIPRFFGIILAAATRREPGAYCFDSRGWSKLKPLNCLVVPNALEPELVKDANIH